MKWIADTHVHLYPCYDLGRWCAAVGRNLRRAGDGAYVACLAERADQTVFHDLRTGRLRLPAGYRAEDAPGGVRIVEPGGEHWWVAPGRQIAAGERLELLALGVDARFPEGEPLLDAYARICDAGGLAVVPWSPGKWFGARGRIVRALLEHASPGTLCVGDSLMRPAEWPLPGLFRLARQRGMPVLAGSDPLPMPGEETVAGGYAVAADAPPELDSLWPALRLLTPGGEDIRGQRQPVLSVARRWRRLRNG